MNARGACPRSPAPHPVDARPAAGAGTRARRRSGPPTARPASRPPLATLARNLVRATPTVIGRPTRSRTSARREPALGEQQEDDRDRDDCDDVVPVRHPCRDVTSGERRVVRVCEFRAVHARVDHRGIDPSANEQDLADRVLGSMRGDHQSHGRERERPQGRVAAKPERADRLRDVAREYREDERRHRDRHGETPERPCEQPAPRPWFHGAILPSLESAAERQPEGRLELREAGDRRSRRILRSVRPTLCPATTASGIPTASVRLDRARPKSPGS